MFRSLCSFLALLVLTSSGVCQSSDNRTLLPIQEEIWALPLTLPSIAYVVHPVGHGPFPIAVMNHGVSLNDTLFGPDLSRRMHAAYTDAGGSAEYHLMPPFGNDGHFFIDSPDAIPPWSPLVSQFLDKHR